MAGAGAGGTAGAGTGGMAGAGAGGTAGAGATDAGQDTAPTDAPGTGGSDGAAGTGGTDAAADGPVTTATGVEKLTEPIGVGDGGGVADGQRYNIMNRAGTSTYDLSGGQTLNIRAYAPGAIGGDISVFFRSLGGADTTPTKVALSTLTSGFVNVPIPVPAATATYNPAMTEIIRMEIEAGGGAFGTTWQTPATFIYIDSIISTNGVVSLPFNAAPAIADFASSGARQLANSANDFLATFP